MPSNSDSIHSCFFIFTMTVSTGGAACCPCEGADSLISPHFACLSLCAQFPISNNFLAYPSALCYLYAKKMYELLDSSVPIAFIDASVGATTVESWCSASALSHCRAFLLPERDSHNPSSLWNGIIAPIFLTIQFKAMLWYQGEQNVGADPESYRCRMNAFVNDIRRQGTGNRQQQLPFVAIQLTGYTWGSDIAETREVQAVSKNE